MLLEQRQHFIVADGAGVGEVVDARLVVRREQDGARQQVVQDGVGVGDGADVGVLRNFGDEGARVQVVRDGHAEAQNQRIWVRGQEWFGGGFGERVEGAGEIGWVGFEVTVAVDEVRAVVGVDTW